VTNPSRLHSLWNWIGHAYFNSPSVTTLGRTFTRLYAGMPSGIFCTNFYDSIYNGVMVVTILLSLGIDVQPNHFIKLMGDDVLFGLLQNIPISHWAEFLEAFALEAKWRFNSKLSSTKCGTSNSINGASILSYTNWNGYPSRPIEPLLAQLLHPKTLRDTKPRLMARAVGIYYASAGDPRVRPICEHIYSTLEYEGYSPHKQAIEAMFDPNFVLGSEIPLDHFPSRTEVISRLLRPSVRSPELQKLYWPREHFSQEAGCSWNCPVQPN